MEGIRAVAEDAEETGTSAIEEAGGEVDEGRGIRAPDQKNKLFKMTELYSRNRSESKTNQQMQPYMLNDTDS